MSDTFEISKQPNPAGINQPESGVYGAVAATDRMRKALPPLPADGAATGQPGMAMPTPSQNPMPASDPGGLPSALFAPTQRPNVPVASPLQAPPVNPVASAVGGMQQRLALLDSLANSPDVSDETREWATIVIRKLIETQSQ